MRFQYYLKKEKHDAVFNTASSDEQEAESVFSKPLREWWLKNSIRMTTFETPRKLNTEWIDPEYSVERLM